MIVFYRELFLEELLNKLFFVRTQFDPVHAGSFVLLSDFLPLIGVDRTQSGNVVTG
jgi:hypothetical protein